MILHFLIQCSLLVVAVIADAIVRPRGFRRPAGVWLHLLMVIAADGAMLAISGAPVVAAAMTAALLLVLAFVSNAKRARLGEPLLFTDVALISSVFRHPQFYLSAVSPFPLAATLAGVLALTLFVSAQFVPTIETHLAGLAVLAVAVVLLAISLALPPWRKLARAADAEADVLALGLLPTMLLHWRRWRATADPEVSRAVLDPPATAGLLIAVQCESFADPAELFGDPALALPGLAAARAAAWAEGRLLVSGFGAYTMRTEYGLIFGRDEDELGFRRFDPYLTAVGEASNALPALLARSGWHTLFVHPHDLRFYGRNRILPAAGFAELAGPDAFAAPAAGRYVTDEAIAELIIARATAARGPLFIHAVTIENHGPWPVEHQGIHGRQSSAYLTLVARGDAMLTRLIEAVSRLRRPAVLLFYGDHRPSIPNMVMPGGDRHTPYVMLRFNGDGSLRRGAAVRRDRTPAQLHHDLINAITGADEAEARPEAPVARPDPADGARQSDAE